MMPMPTNLAALLLFSDRFHGTRAGPRGRMAAHWAVRGGIFMKSRGSVEQTRFLFRGPYSEDPSAQGFYQGSGSWL